MSRLVQRLLCDLMPARCDWRLETDRWTGEIISARACTHCGRITHPDYRVEWRG